MGPMIAIARKHTANYSNISNLEKLSEEQQSIYSSTVNRKSIPHDSFDLIDGGASAEDVKKEVIDLDVIQEKFPQDAKLRYDEQTRKIKGYVDMNKINDNRRTYR